MEQVIDGLNVQRRQYSCRRLQLCPSYQLRVEGEVVIALCRRIVRRRSQQVDDGAASNLITLLRSRKGYLCRSHRLLRRLELRNAVLQVEKSCLRIQLDLVLDIYNVRPAGPCQRLGLMNACPSAPAFVDRDGKIYGGANLVDGHGWYQSTGGVLTNSAQGQRRPAGPLGKLYLLLGHIERLLGLLQQRLVVKRGREQRPSRIWVG